MYISAKIYQCPIGYVKVSIAINTSYDFRTYRLFFQKSKEELDHMNFFLSENLSHLPTNTLKESVLILIEGPIKKIVFHFPLHRFDNYEKKKQLFIKNLQASEQDNTTITTAENYQIYEQFYLIFY